MKRAGTISVHLAGIMLILSLLSACHGTKNPQQEELAAVLDSLDLLIDRRAQFTDLKEARLDDLRSQLTTVEGGAPRAAVQHDAGAGAGVQTFPLRLGTLLLKAGSGAGASAARSYRRPHRRH